VDRFDATTLWHFDAAERAPSATSFALDAVKSGVGPFPLFPATGHEFKNRIST
jgi:hypothetical protein